MMMPKKLQSLFMLRKLWTGVNPSNAAPLPAWETMDSVSALLESHGRKARAGRDVAGKNGPLANK
jgi:hypothetical protein